MLLCCLALSRDLTPLFVHTSEAVKHISDDELKFHHVAHAVCDVLEQRGRQRGLTSVSALRER